MGRPHDHRVILVDTSAWVEFDRATASSTDERLTGLIAESGPLAVTEPVVMEVLAGARTDAREADLRRLLGRVELRRIDPVTDFEAAAGLYRRCRSVGVAPRGLVNCLIAAVAWRHGDSLLAHDADLTHIAEIMGIHVESP